LEVETGFDNTVGLKEEMQHGSLKLTILTCGEDFACGASFFSAWHDPSPDISVESFKIDGF